MSKNPNLIKNGGKGTFFGKLLRGIIDVGKKVSPQLGVLIDSFDGKDTRPIEQQLAKEGFDDNELEYLMEQLRLDSVEIEEITKRWESDMKSDSWLPRNVRPLTLVLYNLCTLSFIALDSYLQDFSVDAQWISILLTNTGLINGAYFGSRYLEKRDNKKYR